MQIEKPMTRADLVDLISFIETKGTGEYNWSNCHTCLGAQYLHSRGLHGNMWHGHFTLRPSYDMIVLPPIAVDVFNAAPHTYEGALERARAALVQMDFGIKNNAVDA